MTAENASLTTAADGTATVLIIGAGKSSSPQFDRLPGLIGVALGCTGLSLAQGLKKVHLYNRWTPVMILANNLECRY